MSTPHPLTRRTGGRAALAACLLATAAACTDRAPTEPLRQTPAGAARVITLQPDGRLASKSLADYASLAVGGDWTPALQQAVNDAQTVYVPAGTYTLKTAPQSVKIHCNRDGVTGCTTLPAAVKVLSNTRIHGAGTGSVLRVDAATCSGSSPTYGASALIAGNSVGGSVTNVIVESLKFEHSCEASADGTDGFRKFALWARRASNLAFRNNHVSDMGLFENDGYLEYGDSYIDVPTGGYAANIEVTGNTGVGRRGAKGHSISQAVVIGYANGATVENNDLRHYWSGLQWWGGNGFFYTGQARKVSNVTARYNQVHHTNTGIWGAMGKDILVASNTVVECLDLCLDAEDSDDVVFEFNTAKYGKNGALGVLYLSRNVTFRWNQVYQNDQPRLDANGDPTTASDLLFTMNRTDHAAWGMTVSAHNNRFEHTGSSGFGAIMKNHGATFSFNANELVNVVVRLGFPPNLGWGGDQGGVHMQSNSLRFTKTVGEPAILVTNNHGVGCAAAPSIHGANEVYVGGNQVSSTVPQSVAGIVVNESVTCPNAPVDGWIWFNTVRDFATSIQVSPSNNAAKRFVIEENGVSAGIVPAASTSTVTLVGNYAIDNQPHRIGYRVHGPSYASWTDTVYGNVTGGTVGQSRTLNAMQAQLVQAGYADGICYTAYRVGSTTPSAACNGGTAGTVGGTNLRAFTVQLDNPSRPSTDYRWGVCYRAHVSNVGWMPEVCDGSLAGVSSTSGTNAVEAIRIRLVAVYDPPLDPPGDCWPYEICPPGGVMSSENE